ncbi:MAG: hypothetical protein F6K24_28520 [Okeania sp. SIO2D1]|nr:hypothetical protein [Okeania sp. SIO2D1]
MSSHLINKKVIITLLLSCLWLSGCVDTQQAQQEQENLEQQRKKNRQRLNECDLLQRALGDALEQIGFPSVEINLKLNPQDSILLTSASAKLAASNAQNIPERLKEAATKLYQLELSEPPLKDFRDQATGKINEMKTLVETSQPELEELKKAVILLSEIDTKPSSPEYKQAKQLVDKAAKAEEVPANLGAIQVHERDLGNLKIQLATDLCL